MDRCRLLAVFLSWTLSGASATVTLNQTHPAAPYVCRTGNTTLRCQYDTADRVSWSVGDTPNVDPSTIPGHAISDSTTTYQELVVDSYTNLRETYQCTAVVGSSVSNSNNLMPAQPEAAEVTLSSLTLASRTATTLSVTWSAGYPKCYSFTVSHSTQDGFINVTQPADSDTSHTLTSLQPGTTYRIEVEAVRKGAGADGQRVKVMKSFTTESANSRIVTAAPVSSGTVISTETSTPLTLRPSAFAEPTTDTPPAGPIVGGVVGGIVGGVLFVTVIGTLIVASLVVVFVHKRKTVPGTDPFTSKVPVTSSQESDAKVSGDGKQTYAVLDWQNPEQRPVKAPDNEWFTVQYSEVHFAGTK